MIRPQTLIPTIAVTVLLPAALVFGGDLYKGVVSHPVPTRLELRHVKTKNEAVIGIVEKMTGPCYVIRGGHGGKSGISIGLRVFEKDGLATDDVSRMHIRYKDGTYVEIGSGSEFQVERIRFNSPNLLPANRPEDHFDESVFRFESGLVRITAPEIHPLERFTIRARSAIIQVTGPADFYLIQLEKDRDLTVRVTKGKVSLMNTLTNESMAVPERMGAYQKVSGVVSTAGAFTEEQLTFLKSRTRI